MKSNDPKCVILRSAYPLTHKGVIYVMAYMADGKAEDLAWLQRNNPPGATLAEILRKLTPEQLEAMWPKLEAAIKARAVMREAKAAQEAANNELKDALHPVEAAARQAAAEKEMADWWEREGKFEDEIEGRGESKYYLYEKSLAEEHGEEYTPQDYLSGRTAFDNERE